MKRFLTKLLFLALGITVLSSTVHAEDVELTDVPLFVSETADPNVMFILDDSGSMQWGFMPDDLIDDFNLEDGCDGADWYAGQYACFLGIDGRRFATSSETNPLYYDPNKTYEPPLKGDGDRYPQASFDGAWIDGYSAANGNGSVEVDLTNNYRAIMDNYYWGPWDTDGFTVGSTAEDLSGERAFYYEFSPPEGANNCESRPYPDSCFDRQEIDADEEQNFANWFSYYRNRILSARAGITAAFIDQPENMRIGYDAIDRHRYSWEEGNVARGVRPFTDDPGPSYDSEETFRSDFFEWLHTKEATGATPLRYALRAAGDYFENSREPWERAPGSSDEEATEDLLECRQSVSILMTDGYWGQDSPDVGNADNTEGDSIEAPDGDDYPGYSPDPPFSDDFDNTLADVAMHYWKRDLRGDIDNRVPTSDGGEDEGVENPAFWQHMRTFGVGLGVEGTIDSATAFDAIGADSGENEVVWPDPTSADGNDSAKIDDLLHAAVNSRGGFFSASDPEIFAEELSSLLGDLAEQLGASTGVTFDTATLEEDSLIFAAQFESGRWSGDLFASPLLSEEGDDTEPPEIGDSVWSAADTLDARDLDSNPRDIITFNGDHGVPFQWSESELNATQKGDLRFGGASIQDARDRIAYLRGDTSLEGGSDGYRERDSRLGDIVNSTPVRVSDPASGWPDSPRFGEDQRRYSDFRAEQEGRTPVIYSGANDGMLHGFRATEDGGEEMLAYVPSAVFSDEPSRGLHHLTNQSYSHRYYVDLPPLAADAFIRGRDQDGSPEDQPEWRTLLLGGSRTGERAIFALDVTDPETFEESNAAQLALWEFTADDDPRMGYITQAPVIALAQWGKSDYRWTAFFGNGYNSPEAATGIFMLDLEGGLDGEWDEGSDYRFVEFLGAGDTGTETVTGLSPVAVYDDDGDRIVDRLYGGDRDGNLWVAAADKNDGIGSPDTYRLFKAETDGESQPITSAPLVIKDIEDSDETTGPGKGKDDSSRDRLVLFGTGQYLNESDLSDEQQQSLYAVRDGSSVGLDRGDLAERNLYPDIVDEQEVLLSKAENEGDEVTNGWYVDLFATGERINLSPQVRGDYVFATSSIPRDNPCLAGGESRTMAFSFSGLTPDIQVFDEVEGDIVSHSNEDGIANPSAFLGDFRFTPTSTGEVGVEKVNTGAPDAALGRQGWQELIE